MSKKTILPTSIVASTIILFGITPAHSEEERYDKSIEAVMIAKAASMMGATRPSINYDQEVKLVTQQDVQSYFKPRTSGINHKIWVAPQPESAMPPIVYRIRTNAIDKTMTAGIDNQDMPSQQKLVWEKFDARGNPIK